MRRSGIVNGLHLRILPPYSEDDTLSPHEGVMTDLLTAEQLDSEMCIDVDYAEESCRAAEFQARLKKQEAEEAPAFRNRIENHLGTYSS